jgi:hypothetical protein
VQVSTQNVGIEHPVEGEAKPLQGLDRKIAHVGRVDQQVVIGTISG